MNTSRRRFIAGSLLAPAVVLNPAGLSALGSEVIAGEPMVISTWDFGQEANREAWKILENNGRAVDAVEAGVRIPEADPDNQSVGYGGLPDRDGRVTLDACIMDEFYNAGSVMCLEHIIHPISVARMVMDKTPHVILTGDGALQFALANGFEKQDLLTPESKKLWEEWLKTSNYEPRINIENDLYRKQKLPGGLHNHDTIGMVAIDARSNLGGACTTSGLAYKMHGRVGDSPVIGAGLYVDNEVGAATSTGVGEEVIKIVGSHLVVELMRGGMSPENACKQAVLRIVKRSPGKAKNVQVGFLALNKAGQYGAYALQPGFSFSVKTSNVDRVFASNYYYR